jgi:NADPH:quinone reductase-like Zn-dependent oxidoreductase
MRAIQIKDGKGPSSNLYIDEQTPVPKLEGGNDRDEILVKVVAFALNRMDILQREGQYPLPPGASPILGVEFSGTVVDAGKSSFKQGEEVFGLATGGAYAEYIKVPARMVLHKPKELSWEQATAIPENFLTAHQALTLLSSLQKGEDVLIHAGASGVGLAAIQIARSMGANKVYVTAGSQEKIDFCVSVGATAGINYKASDWAKEVGNIYAPA